MFNTTLTAMLMYGNVHYKTFSPVYILMKAECDIADDWPNRIISPDTLNSKYTAHSPHLLTSGNSTSLMRFQAEMVPP